MTEIHFQEGLKRVREKEGVAKMFGSNNREGSRVKVKRAQELSKLGWILLYDAACGSDIALPHLCGSSGG